MPPERRRRLPPYEALRAWRKRWWRRSYSQCGEDLVLVQLFRKQDRGVYVDVGCFHPFKFSNTFALYRRGWSGVNVDTSPLKIRLFDSLRPRDHNVLAAVTDRPRDVTLYEFGELSPLDTLDAQIAKRWEMEMGKPYREHTIRGLPLNDILAASDLAGRELDLLNVDVEGHELAILEPFDFQHWRPRVLLVELHADGIADVLASPLYELIVGHGYRLTHWLNPTLLFQRERPPRGES